MNTRSPGDDPAIAAIAQHHGFSVEATTSMLQSLVAGGGAMAQFAHPEFGGAGQWMRGGMTMVGDMFNHQLKARVDALCTELGQLLASRPDLQQAPAGQWQRQGSGTGSRDWREGNGRWWPQDLGVPASAGAQDGLRYAYFPDQRRLALDRNGSVTVHDTLDHRIGGFSQQQGGGGAISLSSQHGPVDIDRLPVLWRSRSPARREAAAAHRQEPPEAATRSRAEPPGAGGDPLALIERLADLHHKGILSDEEFQAKKAELLARL